MTDHPAIGDVGTVVLVHPDGAYEIEFADDQGRTTRLVVGRAARESEAVARLRRALRVANHRPHDQLGEPNEGFPVCSVCGAIQTDLPALGPDGYPVDEMGG